MESSCLVSQKLNLLEMIEEKVENGLQYVAWLSLLFFIIVIIIEIN